MHTSPREFDHVVWVESCRYVDDPGEWLFDVWWIGQYQKLRARAVSESMLGHVVEQQEVLVPESMADDEGEDHPATLGIKAPRLKHVP